MKALVYKGKKTLEYCDSADPTAKDGEVLIRVESVGICGSDMHAFLGHDERRPAPLILGHEAAGTVISGEMKGKRVTVNPLVTCTECEYCLSGRDNLCPSRQIISMPPRQGAFAEFISMPPRNLVEIPDGVSFDDAALTEPLACGWHAVRIGLGALHESVVKARTTVIGGGAIGLGVALCLKEAGVGSIELLENNDQRRMYLSRFKDDILTFNASGAGTGQSDIVFDCAGFSATRELAVASVKPGGVVVHIGLGDNTGNPGIRRITLQEITFIGTYTYTRSDFQETARALFDGRLGSLDWTEKAPLASGQEIFSRLLAGQVAAPKVILKPN